MKAAAPGLVPPAEMAERVRAATPPSGLLEIALDYDGTLVPIAPRPELARADEALRGLLGRLAASGGIRVSVITGRSMADLREVLRPPPGISLFAEHGASAWEPGAGPVELGPRAAVPVLVEARLALAGIRWPAGAWIEDKAVSVALHTRACGTDDAARAERMFREAWTIADPGRDLSLLGGKRVLEVRLPGVHKGLAVDRLRERGRGVAQVIVYAGDDRTDEDAIRALGPRDFGIHVGGPGTETTAAFRLGDWRDLREFLGALAGPGKNPEEGE